MANTSAIWQRAAHTIYHLQAAQQEPHQEANSEQKKLSFGGKGQKNGLSAEKWPDKKEQEGYAEKTGFLHSSNSCFIPSCEWLFLLKVNLKPPQNHWIMK